jgi:hypothetical protein
VQHLHDAIPNFSRIEWLRARSRLLRIEAKHPVVPDATLLIVPRIGEVNKKAVTVRALDLSNIEKTARSYIADTYATKIPPIDTADPIAYFLSLKRGSVEGGPYSGHSLFEVANRTLSDLVVLALANELLREALPGQARPIESVNVLLGTEQNADHDVMGTLPDGTLLRAECFNVAKTFFMSKINDTRNKLRAVSRDVACVKMIAFNHDAVGANWKHRSHWVTHRRVNVDEFLARYRDCGPITTS